MRGTEYGVKWEWSMVSHPSVVCIRGRREITVLRGIGQGASDEVSGRRQLSQWRRTRQPEINMTTSVANMLNMAGWDTSAVAPEQVWHVQLLRGVYGCGLNSANFN